ncbi:stealth family protein [Cognatiyoonia sp. IB215182]|uniref:stealth family protein n=1 Tax=Cognatiyoonia sp. IB215182 TaxID=3097353 RepID=UPI002A176EEB|nr:stealth family protein [Cognatiyoonia sp. IB215182]MDX8354496.1 stealth family protein [Cognatiyoonia sp. IB215182]
MVDAVIAWVDGADPVHRDKREKYANQESTHQSDAYAATRFSDNGELRFCITLIRKHAPWIGRIFLITDAQRPKWLDPAKQSELGVTIVDHKVIFRGHEDALPIFNSISIETVLHRVPNIAERFLYFNDDFFIVKPVSESDYFEGSTPLVRGFYFSKNKLMRELHRLVARKKFKMRGMVGTRFRQEDGIQLSRRVKICHTPHPIVRRDYENLMEDRDRVRRNIKFRFRDQSQFGPIPLYVSNGLSNGTVRVVRRDDLYLDPVDCKDIDRSDVILQLKKECIRHMCVQSWDDFDDRSQIAIREILEELVSA